MAIGGDIIEITYDNNDVGQGSFLVKAGESSTLDLGGFRVDDDAQALTGNGENISVMKRTRWSLETTIVNDQNTRNDLGVLKALASSAKDTNFTISFINGTIWAAKGRPVGDLQADTYNATISVKFSGGGECKKISG